MIGRMEVRELKRRLDAGENLLLLDVRRPEEYAHCRIAGSVLIPLQELSERIDEVPTGIPVITICHHGVRSLSAAAILAAAGLEATSLNGGIEAWSLEVDPSVPRY